MYVRTCTCTGRRLVCLPRLASGPPKQMPVYKARPIFGSADLPICPSRPSPKSIVPIQSSLRTTQGPPSYLTYSSLFTSLVYRAEGPDKSLFNSPFRMIDHGNPQRNLISPPTIGSITKQFSLRISAVFSTASNLNLEMSSNTNACISATLSGQGILSRANNVD